MTNLRQAFDEFLLAGQANGLSPESTRSYKGLIEPFIREAGNETLLIAVDKSYMRQYIADLRERKSYKHGGQKLSRATVDTYVRNLKVFWKWCSAEYGITDPMTTISMPKGRKTQPKAIDPRNFMKLFNETENSVSGERDRALLALLADTGARRSGILSLNIEQVTKTERKAYIYEKGDWRYIYWTFYTQQLLDQWIAHHPNQKGALFINLRDGERLTGSGIYQILMRLKRRAHITGKANPHSFRHNFARMYLQSGGDVVTLASLMGHKDTDMLANFYAVFSPDELAEMQAAHSPLLKMLEGAA
jgi:integrase/recombinase XerD